jgi:hypothetical protein
MRILKHLTGIPGKKLPEKGPLGRGKLACGIAVLTLSAGTALAAGAGTPASAATAVCGRFCMTLYHEKGTDVMAVSGGGFGVVGQALTLSAPGPYYWEDFLSLDEGTVASVYGDGLVSSVADQTWPSDQVYEYEYAPADVPSGLCVGTASPGGDDVPVTLRPCGVTSTVMWILLPQPQAIGHGYAPLINGGDTSVTYPWVLFGEAPMTTYPLVQSVSQPGYNLFEMWEVDAGGL